ncbi:MAG: hypothetical protein WCH98_20705, partial [Verrucomicrobiota bacterium]
MKVHPVIHFLWKNAMRLLLVLIFVGIPGAALYLRKEGIGFGAKEALAGSLSSNAIEVSIGRLALDPFSGLLARDIEIHERDQSRRLLAKISDVALSLNLSELTRGRVAVDKLSLQNAGVSIPVGSAASAPRIDAQSVYAEVIFLGDQLRLSRCEGVIEGIRVELSGHFLNPSSFDLKPAQPANSDSAAAPELIERILRELAALEFPEGPPTLHASLEADFAKSDSLRVDNFVLHSGKIIGKSWRLQGVEVHGQYVDGNLRVSRLHLRDSRGALEASVEWSKRDGALDGAVLSTLDPGQFLRILAGKNEALKNLVFSKPPQVEARIVVENGTDKPSIRVTGMFLAPAFAFKGAEFRDAGCHFAWKDGALYARDVKCSVGRGSFSGKVWAAPGDFRLTARNSIAPTSLLGLFDANTRDFISKMEFGDLPDVTVALRGTKLDFANIRGKGHLALGRTA